MSKSFVKMLVNGLVKRSCQPSQRDHRRFKALQKQNKKSSLTNVTTCLSRTATVCGSPDMTSFHVGIVSLSTSCLQLSCRSKVRWSSPSGVVVVVVVALVVNEEEEVEEEENGSFVKSSHDTRSSTRSDT